MRLGTAETLAFVRRWVPPRARVVEVGCGRGELALELQRHGYDVAAIDGEEAAVEEAIRIGVNAFVGRWPDVEPFPRDVVLFTRSIHHISPLDEAVRRACDFGPRIVIEDFALQEVSAAFAEWLRSELAARGEDWDPPDVHPFGSIRAEVAKHFRIEHEERVPYCYRYFEAPDDRRIYEMEIARGELLGRRLVGVIRQ